MGTFFDEEDIEKSYFEIDRSVDEDEFLEEEEEAEVLLTHEEEIGYWKKRLVDTQKKYADLDTRHTEVRQEKDRIYANYSHVAQSLAELQEEQRLYHAARRNAREVLEVYGDQGVTTTLDFFRSVDPTKLSQDQSLEEQVLYKTPKGKGHYLYLLQHALDQKQTHRLNTAMRDGEIRSYTLHRFLHKQFSSTPPLASPVIGPQQLMLGDYGTGLWYFVYDLGPEAYCDGHMRFPIGFCKSTTVNRCKGHATAEEACVHYRQYLLSLTKPIQSGEIVLAYPCEACGKYTHQGIQIVDDPVVSLKYYLCDKHRKESFWKKRLDVHVALDGGVTKSFTPLTRKKKDK